MERIDIGPRHASKYLFLDVDGVLNRWDSYQWDVPKPLIYQDCAKWFNAIIDGAYPQVVISSSWRHMVHGESMTMRGFEYLLRSHGLRGGFVDVTPDLGDCDRHQEISAWLRKRRETETLGRYCVLDDDPAAGGNHPFVQTDGKVGLTEADAERVIAILNRE